MVPVDPLTRYCGAPGSSHRKQIPGSFPKDQRSEESLSYLPSVPTNMAAFIYRSRSAIPGLTAAALRRNGRPSHSLPSHLCIGRGPAATDPGSGLQVGPLLARCGSLSLSTSAARRSSDHRSLGDGNAAPTDEPNDPPVRPPIPTFLDSGQAMSQLVATAGARADRPLQQMMVSSVLAGAYLSFGGCLYVTVAGGSAALAQAVPGIHALVSALVFPTGISLIVLTGTDLLTSNMLYGALPFFSHPGRSVTHRLRGWARLMAVSFTGNMLGSVAIACCAAAWLFPVGSPGAVFAASLATKKLSLPLAAAVGKAAGANWLVNLAVFQGESTSALNTDHGASEISTRMHQKPI